MTIAIIVLGILVYFFIGTLVYKFVVCKNWCDDLVYSLYGGELFHDFSGTGTTEPTEKEQLAKTMLAWPLLLIIITALIVGGCLYFIMRCLYFPLRKYFKWLLNKK